MPVDHLVLAGLWLGWCILHSLLITRTVTRKVRMGYPALQRAYRLLYVLFSTVSLLPVLLFQRQVEAVALFTWPMPWTVLQWTGITLAFIVLVAGARQYDNRVFLGLAQLRRDRHAEEDTATFSREGILGRIRHPYYSGGIVFLLFWGDVTSATLVSRSILIAYLIIGTFIEERKLLAEHGEEYQQYRRSVPMFIPRFLSRS